MTARYIRGNLLTYTDRATALGTYVHRFTGDHAPLWARRARPSGEAYPVQFHCDDDWLANTEFPVSRTGRLLKGDCISHPTWPNNPELRVPRIANMTAACVYEEATKETDQ